MRKSPVGRRAMSISTVALALAVFHAQPSYAGFCANNAGPSVLYCDDFTDPNALSNYTVTNFNDKYASISVVDDQLALLSEWPSSGGFAAAYVAYNTAVQFRDTAFDARVEFSTADMPRSLVGIAFVGNPGNPNPNYVSWDLQLDEQRAYFLGRIGDQPFSYSTPFAFNANQVYDLTLEVVGTDSLLGFVDGTLVAETHLVLSGLPAQMYPNLGGNAYGNPETEFLTDEIVHVLPVVPEPATWTMMLLGFGGLGLLGCRARRSKGAVAA